MERSDPTATLAAMGQETRYAALRLLVGSDEGVGAGELATSLGVAPSTLSFHMSALLHAGLVRFERRGRAIIYMAESDRVADLLSTLESHLSPRR